jgi:hypothetical protein
MDGSILGGSEVIKNTGWLISTDDVFPLMDRLDPCISIVPRFDSVT